MEPKVWIGWDIFRAAREGRLDITRALIEEKGEDPNLIDDHGHRPLDYAIAAGFLDVRGYLEEKGAQPYLAVEPRSVSLDDKVEHAASATRIPERSLLTNIKLRFLTFDGRIGRQTFIVNMIIGWLMAFGVWVVAAFSLGFYEGMTDSVVRGDRFVVWIVYFSGFFVGLWIQNALGAKRLHDLNQTGWLQAIPLVNLFALLMQLFQASKFPDDELDADDSEGGESPIGSRDASEFEQYIAIVLIVLVAAFYAYSLLEDTASWAG